MKFGVQDSERSLLSHQCQTLPALRAIFLSQGPCCRDTPSAGPKLHLRVSHQSLCSDTLFRQPGPGHRGHHEHDALPPFHGALTCGFFSITAVHLIFLPLCLGGVALLGSTGRPAGQSLGQGVLATGRVWLPQLTLSTEEHPHL